MGGHRSYTVRSGGWIIGFIDEIVEGRSAGAWKYQLLMGVPPDFVGHGITDTLDEAKDRFRAAWQRWLQWAELQAVEDMKPTNPGKAWSEMDDFDLKNELERGRSIRETADFLCRTTEEVESRMREIGLSVAS
jgi:hypothetical protein